MKITPKRYIQFFCIIVVALAWARELAPFLQRAVCQSGEEVALVTDSTDMKGMTDSLAVSEKTEEAAVPTPVVKEVKEPARKEKAVAVLAADEPFVPHKIYSVSSFKNCFPDQNDVQLVAARKNGVKLVKSRADAERRKGELVYVGSNPYFFVDKLDNSLPYLVPKASVLLQDIGKTFYDSLQIKGIPLHKIIVSSVLRSAEDVENLQKRNFNATTQSCHQYGTTVDICYNRYKTVEDPDGQSRRAVTNDTLKWVLSEVLNDMRKQERCYVKYEVKQGCFHITVR